MLKRIREEFGLLIDSGKNVFLFELTYKLAAVAIIYPILIFLLNWGMKVTGIKYLTNGYIKQIIFHPTIVFLGVIAIILFVSYCFYEMAFLSVCFENKRKGYKASIIDDLYNAFLRIKKYINFRILPFIVFSIFAIPLLNFTILMNMVVTETNTNLFRLYILHGDIKLKIGLIALAVVLFIFSIAGAFCGNIFILENKSFIKAYRKSFKLVKNNFFRVLAVLVLYNILIALIIFIIYIFMSVILIIGVKILDLAYMGNAIYLSVLRTVRVIIKMCLLFLAIPMSYSAISYAFYKCEELNEIDYVFVDINEGSSRVNKILYGIVLGVALLCDGFYLVSAFNNNPFEKIAIFHETQITAHRGASKVAPENTLAAFEAAIEDMADCVELDIQMSKDGVLVVMHDPNALRTTGIDRNISDMSYWEIRRLDAGAWYGEEFEGEKVPTLKEVFELCQGKIKMNIEVKKNPRSREMIEKILALIEEYDMEEDCVITSFDYEMLKLVKEKNDNIQTGYVLSMAYGNFYEMKDVDFFSMNASFLSKRVVDAIHNSGKQVYAWTVNNKESIKNLSNKGVDNIITDNPVVAREIIYSRDTSETILYMLKYVFNR